MRKIKPDVIGYAVVIVFAAVTLAAACFGSSQAKMAMTLNASFRGEYKIADGEWNPIVKGESIPATKGDVTLRGYFQSEMPDGEVLGRISNGCDVALYLNHISADIFVNGERTMFFGTENPESGATGCAKQWEIYHCDETDTDVVEIVLKNPHKFGNYNAVNDFLGCMKMYAGVNFEKMMVKKGAPERVIGFAVIAAALALLGISVFGFLLRMRQSKRMLLAGLAMLFAGGYYVLDSANIDLWNNSLALNTTGVMICMMLYSFFVMCFSTKYMRKEVKKAGEIITAVMGVLVCVFFSAPLVFGARLYDMSLFWSAAQLPACILMLGFCVYSLKGARKSGNFLIISLILLYCAMLIDIPANAAGWWQGGIASKLSFGLFFVTAIVLVLKVIPSNYRAAQRVDKMNAELQKSRISIMLSQIQPHFLHNTINVISDLCYEDAEKAREALDDFSTYLRGNIDSLSSYNLIHFSRELMQLEAYLKLEKLRFGDRLNIVYDIETEDFFVPTLTVQPLVENAIKHGICEKESGGTLTLKTRSEGDESVIIEITDEGKGFDTENPHLCGDSHSHIGIANVKSRIEQMAGGSLLIESKSGKGTRVTIRLPQARTKIKEAQSSADFSH